MAAPEIKRNSWRWGIGAALALMLVSLFPQAHFIASRGHEWRGANAIAHPDEVAYSAYLASLIRGNPRRYDPYTGREQTPESLFSIQLVPAYVTAWPARLLGLRASVVFMILPPLCALASSLAIFWLFWLLTRDERISAVAVLTILGFGTLMAGQGIVRHVPNLPYMVPLWISNRVAPASLYHLPFLRLYQPAVAFPLFFVFCAAVWLALTRPTRRAALGAATGAGLVFALLIFSYFYLWTAAAAWLVCVCFLWLVLRRSERKRTTVVFGVIFVFGAIALAPYFRMLSNRAATVDAAQALVFTHRPDLFRLPEIAVLVVLALLGFGVWRGVLRGRDPVVLITAAFALSVLAVYNQQIITGRSLQPIHYQWFIANYCALTAIVLTAALWWRIKDRMRLSNRSLALIAGASLLLAFGEVWLAASVSFDHNRRIDESIPLTRRLVELARADGALTSGSAQTVLMADLRLADRLPTDAPQSVLWAPRMLVFPGVSEAENRERFFSQLYYLGYDDKKFWAELDTSDWNFLAGLFPYPRLSTAVNGNQTPITPDELRAQLGSYLEYVHSFNRDRAAAPTLAYLVVRADSQPDYANLDRWYQRDSGERIGNFILYRLRLRD
ncbi:MAG TPA: hypothetical protein VK582_08570 [Pyrinomonadaceae bacterium]|nr:hypothetical protein [Pyrinomonadaceae bacterium]